MQLASPGQDQEVAPPGEAEGADLVVALGGDGTTLAALRAAAPVELPVLGVACGSLGALTAVTAEELEDALERVAAGDWTERRLPALVVERDGEEARLRSSPNRLKRRSDWTVAFTLTPRTPISASRLRLPGSSMIPARTPSRVETRLSSLPMQATRPARGGIRPARESKSWGWPLPSAPAIPTTSPLCSVKLTGPKDCPCRASTTSTSSGSSGEAVGGGNAASNGRPTIRSTSSGSEVVAASKVP